MVTIAQQINIALYVPFAIQEEFSKFSYSRTELNDSVEAVVIGDLDQQWTYEKLNHTFQLLMGKSKPNLIALGMPRYRHANNGLCLDAAPFVMALQYASMVQPVVLGKPSGDYYRMALSLLNANAEDTVIIGDDLHTDIEGGQQLGMRDLLVRTGKFMECDLKSDVHPYAVLDSVADLPAWWAQHAR